MFMRPILSGLLVASLCAVPITAAEAQSNAELRALVAAQSAEIAKLRAIVLELQALEAQRSDENAAAERSRIARERQRERDREDAQRDRKKDRASRR